MRVALVSMYTPHHEATGATRRTRRTAKLLADRGHEVTVFCARWWDGDVTEFERHGVAYRAVTGTPSPRSFGSKLPFALRKVRPDVIQAANHPPTNVSAAKTAGRLLRTPVIVDWWDDVAGDSRAAYRRAVRKADSVVVPSQMTKTKVREYGVEADDVRVVPDPIDMSLIRDAEVDRRADVVYARDLDEDANVGTLLLALAELRDREWRAAIIGDGPARPDAERMAIDLRIDDRVEFLGELPAAEGVPVMKGAHVFAQTAEREPFATNLLWALAAGCVGIVEYQADSSAHELVEGCDRGVRVTSPGELADEIVAAASLDRLTINEAFDSHDRREIVDRYLDCYRETERAYGLF